MRKSEVDNSWLQPVLRRGLGRVPAPGELWNRIAMPRLEEVHCKPSHSLIWMLACTSAVTISVLAMAWGYHPGARADFRSDQVSEVRTWIRNRTGLDIPLAAHSNPAIEMIGASIAQTGAVEVRYRAANRHALLVVWRSSAALPEHPGIGDIQHATAVSWTAGSHAYTLSVQRAGDMRMACLVCHTESTI